MQGVNRITSHSLSPSPFRSKTQTAISTLPGRLFASLRDTPRPRGIQASKYTLGYSSRCQDVRYRVLQQAPLMGFLLAAALSCQSKLIGIELCRWTLMEINHNQITHRLRRNSSARTTWVVIISSKSNCLLIIFLIFTSRLLLRVVNIL